MLAVSGRRSQIVLPPADRPFITPISMARAREAASARFPSCRAATLNVTDGEAVGAIIARDHNANAAGSDIVVNNAGVNTLGDRVPIDQFSREEWDRMLNVDLTGFSK